MSSAGHRDGRAPSVRLAWCGPYPALLVGIVTGPGDFEVPDIAEPAPLPGWAVHVAGSTLARINAPGHRWRTIGADGHPVELPVEWLGAARRAGGVLIIAGEGEDLGGGRDLSHAVSAASAAGRVGLAPLIAR